MASKENLIEEIIANARRDRRRLEEVADGLMHGFSSSPIDEESDDVNPEVAAAFAEEIAKISDSLTKTNQQLVELVKIESKKEPAEKQISLDKKQVDEVYEEIQPQEVN